MMQRLHPAQGPLGAGNSALDQKVLAVGSESPTMMAPSPAAARPSEAVLATVAMASEPAAAPSPAASSPAAVPAAPSAPAGTRPRRYLPVRQLGEGGMGEVLLSVDSAIGRQVAVKRMKPRPDLADASGQFLAEVQTTGQLEHPGIVPIYDAGQDEEGNPYFVMKYFDGEPLDRIIAKLEAGEPEYVRRFSYEHRTEIFMQLLRAVQYAHKRGVLHLDIKPANVLVGQFGEVVLVDWGIARSVPSPDAAQADGQRPASGAARALSGTPAYMSPEQAMGDPNLIDQRTDTYCLCVLFYELVTLHYYLPVKKTMQGCLTSILMDEPMTALQMHHRFGTPPELTNFIRPGLEKDPARRYQSVDAMVDALQNVINGQIPVVCPCTGIKRTASIYADFMDAHPILAVAGVALMALFALFGLFEVVRLSTLLI